MSLADELEANFDKFTARYETELTTVRAGLVSERKLFVDSYGRIASLNAWRDSVLAAHLSPKSLAFFLEAQNDALTSHVFARFGSWRSCGQSLRSCIENTMMCLYFKDHPVELTQWHALEFKIGFTALYAYLTGHPDLAGTDAINGLIDLKAEYQVLCKAVHGGEVYRMTVAGGGTRLWTSDKASAGKWATRERETLRSINLLLAAMFRDHLQGAKLPALRSILKHILPASKYGPMKQHLGIVL